MCTSESSGREADAERCCNAQRPASVRVVTTVETPHNVERQKEGGGGGVEGNRAKKKRRKIHWSGPNRVKTNAPICRT